MQNATVAILTGGNACTINRLTRVSKKNEPYSPFAQKSGIDNELLNDLTFAPSTIERIGSNKISQSELDWVIGLAGQPVEQPDLKKPTTLRGVVGVWDCESGDRIRGRDGACFHAVGFLARSERLEHNQCHGLFLSFPQNLPCSYVFPSFCDAGVDPCHVP